MSSTWLDSSPTSSSNHPPRTLGGCICTSLSCVSDPALDMDTTLRSNTTTTTSICTWENSKPTTTTTTTTTTRNQQQQQLPMVPPRVQSSTRSSSSSNHNQLLQPISPFEELVESKPETMGGNGSISLFDDQNRGGTMVVVGATNTTYQRRLPPTVVNASTTVRPQPKDDRDGDQDGPKKEDETRQEDSTRDGIPVLVSVQDSDLGSEISLEAFLDEARTLTPFLSFDDTTTMTARDFHYLFQASQRLGEQDWPSDEDCDPPLAFKNKNLKVTVRTRRSNRVSGEI